MNARAVRKVLGIEFDAVSGGSHTRKTKEIMMNVTENVWKARISTVLAGLAAVATIAGCTVAGAAPSAAPTEVTPPEAVVQGYYDWYLGYERELGDNPLADGAYRASDLLADGFVTDVDELLASFCKGGYDPFLCAQDLPQRLTVGAVEMDGHEATVTMDALYTGNPMASHFPVTLTRANGDWRITGIACGTMEPTPLTAEQTVQNFYDLYLEASLRRNLLAEGAHRDLPFLAGEFVEKVDAILASFDKGGYDPILYAQDVPQEITVTGSQVEGQRATVELATSFEGHTLTVTTELRGGGWVITDVTCTR